MIVIAWRDRDKSALLPMQTTQNQRLVCVVLQYYNSVTGGAKGGKALPVRVCI